MEIAMREPKSLQEAIVYFSDADRCLEYLRIRRWPKGVVCPTCGNQKVGFLMNQRKWQCGSHHPKRQFTIKVGTIFEDSPLGLDKWLCGSHHPKRQFTIKVGTIFEDSPLGLDKWLCAMWLLVNCKNGISSYEVARDLGISQKSAWHMMHRIRLALQSGSLMKLGGDGGEVEVDETFIGGKARNMHVDKR